MKKVFLSCMLAFVSCTLMMAQAVHENDAVVVYYMPKTELVINLQYEITTQTPGVFYQYAKRYLGTENVIVDTTTQYTLKEVKLTTKTSIDHNRTFQVAAQKGINTQLLSLTEDGRLLGYNIAPQQTNADNTNLPATSNLHDQASNIPTLLPLLEEQFIAGTTAKMAEGAAKQIYRIREMRLNLLAGEVEHVPADGKAMQLVLDELSKREAELVALFVGTTSTKTGTHTLYYTPYSNKKQEVICRFSKHTGVVDSNDLSGSPIYINTTASKPTKLEAEPVNSKAPIASPIYYNLPGHTTVAIEYNGKTICNNSFAVAQYGIEIPLSMELFVTPSAPSIYINPETGNILSIKQ